MITNQLHADISSSSSEPHPLDCFPKDSICFCMSNAANDSLLLHEFEDPIPWMPQRKFRIFLVEEDECGRNRCTSSLLRACGYQVTSVRNCQDAWKILLSNVEQVDLVISDVFSPGLSGINLLSLINEMPHLKHVPVIMISSQDSMDVIFKCLSKGAVDVLIKPLRKNELKNIWQHIWRRNCNVNIGCEATQSIVSPQQLDSFGSSAEECDFGIRYNAGDESDACSGTQISWRTSKDVHDDEVGVDSNLAHSKILESLESQSRNYVSDAFSESNS